MAPDKEILIVEDSQALADNLKEGLSQFGCVKCKVDCAIDGNEGLKKVKNNHYDLIITDFVMPKKNGSDFIRELRKINSYKETPVIFMSGYFKITPIEEYEDIITEDHMIFLDKPFRLGKIRDAINYVFGGNQLTKTI